jgi:hypothetical protein
MRRSLGSRRRPDWALIVVTFLAIAGGIAGVIWVLSG